MFIAAGSYHSCVATDYNIYICKISYCGKFLSNEIFGKRFNDKIVKIIVNDNKIVLLFSNGNLLVMHHDKLTILAEASEVSELYPYIINRCGKYYFYYEVTTSSIAKIYMDYGLFIKKLTLTIKY
jgi:hypothetical protein